MSSKEFGQGVGIGTEVPGVQRSQDWRYSMVDNMLSIREALGWISSTWEVRQKFKVIHSFITRVKPVCNI